MRIIQVNTTYKTGSTGKIAASLYELAENAGMDSYFAYGRNNAPAEIKSYKIGNRIDFCFHVLTNFFRGNSGFGSKDVTLSFLQWLDIIKPDILHLHNIHGFYLHIGILFDYIKNHNIAIVWTLHDCWSFTGQCAHFDYAGCEKWMHQCYNCPLYRSNYPYSLFKDNSRQNYLLKRESFTGVKNLTIVTPSKWLANKVKASFLQDYPLHVIPNGIDLSIFNPTPPEKDFSLYQEKIVLGVANVWNTAKGLDTFLQLSRMLDSSYKIMLIGLRKSQCQKISKSFSNIISLERTMNQQELASLYSNAYAFVNPTLEDNFPTTNLEALACGTPVITYNTGGSPESLTPECGIIVPQNDVNALCQAILSLENNKNITKKACLTQALNFNQEVNFQDYINLYRKMVTS